MQIELKNIKRLKTLSFNIPQVGVWLLTGINGAGKTSLLAALFRLGSKYAFQKYYRTTTHENRLDSFMNAQVSYNIDGKTVSYRYSGLRWAPTPRRHSSIRRFLGACFEVTL